MASLSQIMNSYNESKEYDMMCFEHVCDCRNERQYKGVHLYVQKATCLMWVDEYNFMDAHFDNGTYCTSY